MSLIMLTLMIVVTMTIVVAICDPKENKLRKIVKTFSKIIFCCLFLLTCLTVGLGFLIFEIVQFIIFNS